MHAKLKNGNGVVMYLAGETEGLASSMGAQAFEVEVVGMKCKKLSTRVHDRPGARAPRISGQE